MEYFTLGYLVPTVPCVFGGVFYFGLPSTYCTLCVWWSILLWAT